MKQGNRNTEYKYVKPEGTLYKVSQDKWNKQFNECGNAPYTRVDVYVTDELIVCEHVYSKFGLSLLVLGYPFLLMVGTASVGFKSAIKTLNGAIRLRTRGGFYRDVFHKGSKQYNDVKVMLMSL